MYLNYNYFTRRPNPKLKKKPIEMLLPAEILDFISPLVILSEFITVPKCLNFLTPSNTCLSID